ncbi:GGDEF domain-containing protein [Aestuariibacter sp. AA17]|uniref:diguanylate cyclase n=1 Tax=Fluctibacter corallii TaxID=2984329 RepID=A0ABT3A859_9ALTE|nr:GGDEF domain-containing protein [Aestuariibacter sp. AA17]
MFILFILVTSVAYFRLVDFQHILSHVTEESIPKLAVSGQVYSEVNNLTFMTENLTRANNEAALRISNQEIQRLISHLRTLASTYETDPYLLRQLDALELELSELSELVALRISYETQLSNQYEAMYALYEELLSIAARHAIETGQEDIFGWQLTLATVASDAGKIRIQNRIGPIRALSREIDTNINALKAVWRDKSGTMGIQITTLLSALDDTLNGDEGIANTRILQLQLRGRTLGRGNFLRNLILDYAQNAELEAGRVNRQVVIETQKTSQKVKQQIRIIGIAALITTIIIVSISYLLKVRVVNRLANLNRHVRALLQGRDSHLSLTGNDEITDIADTLDVFVSTVAEQNKMLLTMSMSDGLTGIPNRRAFDERIAMELATCKRHAWPLTVILLDVDYFKLYNDNYGHLEGDSCLVKLAHVLEKQKIRSTDFVCRYGGEEFAVLLPDTDPEGAEHFAKRIKDGVFSVEIPHEHSPISNRISVSLGVVVHYFTHEDTISAQTLLKIADDALYKAKQNGRNQYTLDVSGDIMLAKQQSAN